MRSPGTATGEEPEQQERPSTAKHFYLNYFFFLTFLKCHFISNVKILIPRSGWFQPVMGENGCILDRKIPDHGKKWMWPSGTSGRMQSRCGRHRHFSYLKKSWIRESKGWGKGMDSTFTLTSLSSLPSLPTQVTVNIDPSSLHRVFLNIVFQPRMKAPCHMHKQVRPHTPTLKHFQIPRGKDYFPLKASLTSLTSLTKSPVTFH